MEVTLLDSMGSDITVVNVARVSFDKKSSYVSEYDRGIRTYSGLSSKDKSLIKYLAKHQHWSPFAHPQVMFRVKAPIFVARQLAKHQVGAVWNEVSRRYVKSEPEFYYPDGWRKSAENVKQGSSDELVTAGIISANVMYRDALVHYNWMLDNGVCPEQARMVLPQATYTEWIWTGSLLFFSRVYNLRTDPHAQKETKVIADKIGYHIKNLFPISWDHLIERI